MAVFVFIGKNLDKDVLREGFLRCKCSEKTRFKVGDKVLANIGKWVTSRVAAIWDDGNPYRIELDEDGRNIWAPIDSDDFVRACSRSNRGKKLK